MNKITGFMGAALLTGGILAGCSADSENAVPEENTTEEALTPVETEETEPTKEAEPIKETEPTPDDTASDTSKTAENVIEKVDKATQEVQEGANNATETVEQKAAEVGDAVEETVSDVQKSVDNKEVTEEEPEPEPAPAATKGQEASGIFNGMADPHTVEIEVDGVPAAYQVDPDGEAMTKFEELTEGDSVTFMYVENGEQLVIEEVK